ncbi:MAG: thioredoxin [Hymenobacter sp.]|nr:thioredoxin [Hymenobacter sp.]
MILSLSATSLLPAEAAVLLILLPPVAAGTTQQAQRATVFTLNALQRQLGAAIRVLLINETNYPAVVRSFGGRGLPAFVLLRHGVELWCQQGLPEGPAIAELLLSKLAAAPGITQPAAVR